MSSGRSSPDPCVGPSPLARAVLLAAAAFSPAAAPAAAALALVPSRAVAQQGVVSGTVVAEGAQRPLADAQVLVEGTTLGGATDANGRFRIAGVSGTEVRLTVRRIGYRPTTVTARVGDSDLRITLAERAVELNQVVVTGTAGVAEKRAIGNAVSTVKVSDVVATQPVRNVQDLLTGRASGVSVVASSGQVGTGSRIRVRGASSLSLGNDPLIYVDGVRVDNAQATGPTVQAFGSASVSRFNDFNPNDIESIEVIKGPAAATLYGTEASNGVIQIITKKGSAGRTVANAVAKVGGNWLPGWRGGYGYVNYGPVTRAGTTTVLDTVPITIAQLNDSLNSRFGNDIFRTGGLRNMQASLSGGTTALRYYVGLSHDEEEGVERANSLQRTGVRANLTASPWRTVDVTSSLSYVTGRTYLPYESGGGGATWATFFSSPQFLYNNAASATQTTGNPQLGFRSGPPDVYYSAYKNFQGLNRFTSSVNITNRPASWLDHRLILGLDQADEDNQEQAPRNDDLGTRYASFSGLTGANAGGLVVGARGVRYVTADYAFNAKAALPMGWQSVTSAGGQFYGRRTRLRVASASGFPAAGFLALTAGATQRLDQDDLFDNNTLGGFIQEQLIWNDRLFLTGAVRRDDNSAFGTDYPAVTYPKLSASYVLSDEPSLPLPDVLNTLRVRGAFGGSGLQPGAFDAIRTYSATGGLLTPSNAGNPNLGPEKSYETELGLDAGLWQDRLGAELTFYTGYTRDAILSRLAAPSAGFPGQQLFNAGRVDRRGFEWQLRAQPISTPNYTLDLGINGSTTKYEIASLGEGTQTVSLSSNIQHVVGYAPGAWWDRRIVSADYNPTTKRAANLLCDDGKGGTVGCASAPRVFLGNSVPTHEGSFNAALTFLRDFRLNGFVDYRGGYKKLDGNLRVRCGAFTLCRELYYPDEVEDKATLAAYQAGTAYTYHLIKDAKFVRFRELALTYTLPRSLATRIRSSAASITVAGRNLHLWTDYTGLEPEASFNGGTRGGQFGQWEQNVLPQTRSLVATFNVSF
jgi:TonB-linked SusC/RagA family outer membrane protein